MISTSVYYHRNASTFYERYRGLTTPEVLGNALLAVPETPSLVLDLGSGSGRDSEWLGDQGHTVVSVEPADALRELAQSSVGDRKIIHYHTSLPDLQGLDGFGGFDFVLCSAVWMHIRDDWRTHAAARLHDIMKPGATAVVTFKVAPEDLARQMFEIDPETVLGDFHAAGFAVEMTENVDLLGRDETRWFTCILAKGV